MQTKLSILQGHMATGRWVEALRLANSFQQLGKHAKPIRDAWDAHQSPSFYKQIGKDPAALWEAGKAALVARYGPEA